MIADIYELSPLQAGMLFQQAFGSAGHSYFNRFACRLTGDLDVVALRAAWQSIVDRHTALRTSFHWEGLERPVQVVHDGVAVPWVDDDWRGLSEDAQRARWDAWLQEDLARGFDVGVAPLLRLALFRVADSEYLCAWSHHHLVLDGWCLGLILDELFAQYEARRVGRTRHEHPARPYGEFVAWLRRQDREALSRYWRESLAGMEAPTAVPGILPATVGQPPARPDRIERCALSDAETHALKATAAAHRVTIGTLVQGAWALVLARRSGSDDVVFGTTVSGRPPDLPGADAMLGLFINTVPVRVSVPEDMTAAAWFAQLQVEQVAREAHASLALSDIQRLSPVAPGLPLFATNVIVMNYPLDEQRASGRAGLTIRDVTIQDQTDIPLTVQAVPGTALQLEVLYDAAHVDPLAARRMLDEWRWMLQQCAADLERPLQTFTLVSPETLPAVLAMATGPDGPLDLSATVLDAWDAQVALRPDAIALVCDDRCLTFREVDARATRWARALCQAAPLSSDALVALAFPRSEQMVIAMLATWKCGAAYLPLDPHYPDARLQQVLDTARPALLVRDEGGLSAAVDAFWAPLGAVTSVQALDAAADEAPPVPAVRRPTGRDLAYVIFTSGSTGRPKGAMVEHTGMLNHLQAKIEDLQLGPDSRVVQNASHCFDISVWQSLAGMVAGGQTIVCTDALVRDPDVLLAQLRAACATVLEVVPSYLGALLDGTGLAAGPWPELTVLLVTGEVVKPALIARWFQVAPTVPVVNAYGPTEASDDITHAWMDAPPTTASVPVGRPIRNLRVYVLDARQRLCPPGVPGEVCVSGPGVGRGYLHDAARTTAVFLDDPFREVLGVRMYRTGDVGTYAEDGTLLLAGRRDDQVKVRGFRIELGDVEAALASLPSVRESAVVHRAADGRRGGALTAYVSLREGAAATGADLLAALAQRVPEYMVPGACLVLNALPVTANGKIDRRALPAPAASDVTQADDRRPPQTATERALATIWRDVLGVEEPGLDDNYFALGGDSISSMQVASRAARVGLTVTLPDIFRHPTLGDLAAAVAAAPSTVAALTDDDSSPAPLTPAQAAYLDATQVDVSHYNQSVLLDVPEGGDAERCREVLAHVFAHHGIGQLRVRRIEGVWRQVRDAVVAPLAFVVHDLSALRAEEVGAASAALATTLHTSLDIEAGPLVRVAYLDQGRDRPARLLIVAHHLLVDGQSWRVLLEDVVTAWGARPASVALPPASSVLAWARVLERWTHDGSWVETELRTWASPARHRVTALPLSPGAPAQESVETAADMVFSLDRAQTARFLALTARPEWATGLDLLLAGVVAGVCRWADRRTVLVDVEAHGRDIPATHADVTRMVGWLTATYPLLCAHHAEDPAAQVRHVAAARRAVPTAGVGYGVLRYLGDAAIRAQLAAMPQADVLVNYHGRIDTGGTDGWRVVDGDDGVAQSTRHMRTHRVEVNALVADGTLRVHLQTGRLQLPATEADRLRDAIAQALRQVSETCALDQFAPDAPRVDSGGTAADGDIEESYPLSPTQAGMLFHARLSPAGDAYFNQWSCTLQGPLDVDVFVEAWRRVVARHAALRTSFVWTQQVEPQQRVHRAVVLPWRIDDWTPQTPAQQDAQWAVDAADDRLHPFDLTQAPLMRATLVRMAADRWRFRLSQHHLLLDGWSAAIVLDDVWTCYAALRLHRTPALPDPPSYRAALAHVAAQDREAAETYWRQALEGFTTATLLPLGLPGLEGRSHMGRMAVEDLMLPSETGTALQQMAASLGLTMATVWQGIWGLLLQRWSGDADVVFGAVVSGRPAAVPDVERTVGLFINIVPVRVRSRASETVAESFRSLQLAAAEREPYSYGSLADVQRWSGVDGAAPLFESILLIENYPASTPIDADAPLVVRDVQTREPNSYPLTLVVTPGVETGVRVMYDDGRFDAATVQRMLGHLRQVIDAVVRAPLGTRGAIDILTPEEHQAIATWNATDAPLGEDTVPGLVLAQAARVPARVAVRCGDDALTYGALVARADALAARMRAESLDAEGARVAVLLPRATAWVVAVLATWRCRAVYVPIDPEWPDARVASILERAQPALVVSSTQVCDVGVLQRVAPSAPVLRVDAIEETAAAADGASAPRVDDPRPSDAAYIIFTSGSTGTPKGAVLEHRGFLNHVLSMRDDLRADAESVVAQTASQSFDISMWQLWLALTQGGTTVIYPEALVHQPRRLAERMAADGITLSQFVPSYLAVWLDAVAPSGGAPRVSLPLLRTMVVIGEALPHATATRWFACYPGIPLMNAYGPTEASDSVTHLTMVTPPPGTTVPIGWPIRNLTVSVRSADGQVCPVGVKGEIWIGGAGVGRGYLFDAERTAAAFIADPDVPDQRLYRSGDVGARGPDGCLYFFGRRDLQVKVRGHRLELGEIERVLVAAPGVREAVVVVLHNGQDATLCGCVTALQGYVLDADALADHVRAVLPRYAIPDRIRVFDQFPTLPSGKIDRRALTAQVAVAAESAPTPTLDAPANWTNTERQVAEIWQSVLQRPRVEPEQSFFDLGGHSLSAMQAVARIAEACGVEVSLADFFETPTVRGVARHVDARAPHGRVPAVAASGADVSLADRATTTALQRRMWLASQTPAGATAYQMVAAFDLIGAVDQTALRRAFAAVVRRHESLRTGFVVERGTLRARVSAAADVPDVLTVAETPLADEAAQRAHVRAFAAQPVALNGRSLLAAQFVPIMPGRARLLVRLHHIVGDATSMRIVMADVLSAYAAVVEGRPVLPAPLTAQYGEFVAWRAVRAQSPAGVASREHWTRCLQPPRARGALTPDRRHPEAAPSSGVVQTVTLDAACTAALQQQTAAAGTTLFAALVAAIGAVMARHGATEQVAVDTTVSLRDDERWRDQVGCYVDTVPVLGTVAAADTGQTLLTRIGSATRQAVAHTAVLPEDVAEAIGDAARPPWNDVLVDLLYATADPPMQAAGLTVVDVSDLQDAPHYDIMCLGELSPPGDGQQFAVRIVGRADRYSPAAIDAFSGQIERILRWMAANDGSPLTTVAVTPASPTPRRRLQVVLDTD